MNTPKFLLLSMASSLLVASEANAGTTAPAPEVTPIEGVLGNVKIGEFVNPTDPNLRNFWSPLGVSYFVDILNPNFSITGIAISTNSPVQPSVNPLSPLFSQDWVNDPVYFGWTAQQYNESGWNANPLLAVFGSFDSLFGDDLFANVFNFGAPGGAITEASDQDMAQWENRIGWGNRPTARFGLESQDPDTDFVAFNGNTIVDQSRPTDKVADGGSTLALLGLSLAGLALRAKGRRQVAETH